MQKKLVFFFGAGAATSQRPGFAEPKLVSLVGAGAPTSQRPGFAEPKLVSLVGAGAPTSQPPGFAGPQLCGNSISFCSTSKLFLSINFAQKSLSFSSELGLQHPGGTIPKNSSFVIISHTHPPHR